MTPKNTSPYSQAALLNDKSIQWDSVDKNALLAQTKAHRKINSILNLLHPEVRYEVTDYCNAECTMCPREKHKTGRSHGIMDLSKFQKSIDEVTELGCKRVVLTGFGEPLIDPGLNEKIQYAKIKGLATYVISNASLLSQERALDLIQSGLDELRISFLGMSETSYETIMKKLDFEESMVNILNLLKVRKRLKRQRPRVQLSWLITPQNEHETRQFQDFWEPLVDAIEIWRPHNFGDGRDYRKRFDSIDVKTTCGRPENGPLQIQWNGEVVPCCYDYNNQIVLGNAFDQPVLDILNEQKYELLRIAHREKKFKLFPFCNQCDQLLEHKDALVYTNRHNLPAEDAIKRSNTDLFDLSAGTPFNPKNYSKKYTGSSN